MKVHTGMGFLADSILFLCHLKKFRQLLFLGDFSIPNNGINFITNSRAETCFLSRVVRNGGDPYAPTVESPTMESQTRPLNSHNCSEKYTETNSEADNELNIQVYLFIQRFINKVPLLSVCTLYGSIRFIIKTSSTGPSRKNKVVYKLLPQPHKHLRQGKLKNKLREATSD